MKKELEELLLLYKQDDIELEDVILSIINLYKKYGKENQEDDTEEKYTKEDKKVKNKVKNSKMKEKDEDMEEKDTEDEDVEEVKEEMYSSKVITGIIEADDKILEAVRNTKHKVPLNYEHVPNKIIGEVLDFEEKDDKIIIRARIDDEKYLKYLKEDYYFSPEILVLKENDEEYRVVSAVALTSSPALASEKVELVPVEVYSALPKAIKKLIYTHPDVLKFLKKKIPAFKFENKNLDKESKEEKVKRMFWSL